MLLFEFQHDELLKVFHSSGRAGGIIVSEEPIRKHGLSAADIHHRSDAAGIPLVDGPVSQPLLVRHHVPVPLFPDAPGSATGGHAGRFFDPFRVINTIKKDTGGQGEALPETSVSSVSYRIPRFERLCQFVKVFKKSLTSGHIIAHIAVDSIDAHVII